MSGLDFSVHLAQGTCEVKCDLRYAFKRSSAEVQHRGEYLSFSFDPAAADVRFNRQAYTLREARLYGYGLHRFEGQTPATEWIVVLEPALAGQPLYLCLPARQAAGQSDAQPQQQTQLVREALTQVHQDGEHAALHTLVHLGQWLEQANPATLTYEGAAPCAPWADGAQVVAVPGAGWSLPYEVVRQLRQTLRRPQPPVPPPPAPALFANAAGLQPEHGGDDDLYIDCVPVDGTPVPDESPAPPARPASSGRGRGRFAVPDFVWWTLCVALVSLLLMFAGSRALVQVARLLARAATGAAAAAAVTAAPPPSGR